MYSFLESNFSRYNCSSFFLSLFYFLEPMKICSSEHILKTKSIMYKVHLVSYPKKHGQQNPLHVYVWNMSYMLVTLLHACPSSVHRTKKSFYFYFLDIRHGLSLTLSLSFSLSHTVKLSRFSLLPSRFAPSLGQSTTSQSDLCCLNLIS